MVVYSSVAPLHKKFLRLFFLSKKVDMFTPKPIIKIMNVNFPENKKRKKIKTIPQLLSSLILSALLL